MFKSLSLFLTLALTAGSASALTLFVDQQTGDNMDDGLTQETAVATVSAALGLAMQGDVISVGPGTYSVTSGEVLPLRFTGSITIEGAGEQLTVIDGEMMSQVVSLSFSDPLQTVRLASLAVVNGNSAIGAGFAADAPGILEVEGVRFEGNAGSIGGAIHVQINGDQDSQILIKSCTFLDNAASIGPGLHIQQNGAGQHDAIVENSVFRRHDNAAIQVSRNDGGSILTLRSTVVDAGSERAISATISQLNILNSTITGTRDLVSAGSGLMVVNSILVSRPQSMNQNLLKGNSNQTVIRGSGGNVRDSIVSPLNVDGHTVGDNVLDVDPLLTADARLTNRSPARDRGDDSVVVDGDLDIDGQPRIQGNINRGGFGGLVDLGADELGVLLESSFEDGEG